MTPKHVALAIRDALALLEGIEDDDEVAPVMTTWRDDQPNVVTVQTLAQTFTITVEKTA
jgi:hypothetical protein